MKKRSELIDDIRTDMAVLNNSCDIAALDRASNRLAANAKELRRRVNKWDEEYKLVEKLERYGF